MQANPVFAAKTQRQASSAGRDLIGYCHWLNSLEWVNLSGLPFVVRSKAKENGQIESYLDRGNA